MMARDGIQKKLSDLKQCEFVFCEVYVYVAMYFNFNMGTFLQSS